MDCASYTLVQERFEAAAEKGFADPGPWLMRIRRLVFSSLARRFPGNYPDR